MQEPVEDRGGQDLVAEDGAPLRHHLVGRNEQTAALVAARDELKEEMRAAAFEGQIAELIDEEELRLTVKHQPIRELSVRFGFRERGQECGGTREEDGVPGLDDGAAECDREMRFADARRAED